MATFAEAQLLGACALAVVACPTTATAGGTLSGRYLLLQQTTTIATAPVAGTFVAKSRAVSLHDLTHRGDRLQGSGELCDVAFDSGSRFVKTVMPERLRRSLPHPRIDAMIRRKGSQTLFEQAKQTVVVGAKLDRPAQDRIPTHAHDPRVYDQDGDGHPGVTMEVEGIVNGKIYLVQRNWSKLDGILMRHGFAGWIRFGSERTILGTTSWMLDNPPEARADPSGSYFRLVRVADDIRCGDALALAKEL